MAMTPSAPPLPSDTLDTTVAACTEQALRGSLPAVTAGHSRTDEDRQRQMCQGLLNAGVPFGLAHLVSTEDCNIALRIFLLDNSGSTAACDGKYFDSEAPSKGMVPCSRWEEIRRMALQQAALNVSAGIPCEFILLNPPRPRDFAAFQEGVDFATVDPRCPHVQTQLATLQQMLQKTRPQGTTPLGERLKEIHHRIRYVHGDLASHGSRVVVVVATDGLPTSPGSNLPSQAAQQEVATQLRQLTNNLPVFVVARLTTDEDAVVAFYNRIDEEEELPLEVIDDFESEAREIAEKGNGWLTYSPIIHMIREAGTQIRLLDALDERQFRSLEVQQLVAQILRFQEECDPLPTNADEFCREVQVQLASTPLVYDPLQRRMAPCLHMQKLRAALGISQWAACFRCIGLMSSQSEARRPLMQ